MPSHSAPSPHVTSLDVSEARKRDAFRDIIYMTAAAMGLGVAGRSSLGLARFMQPKPPLQAPVGRFTRLALPTMPTSDDIDEGQDKLAASWAETAGNVATGLGDMATGAANTVRGGLRDVADKLYDATLARSPGQGRNFFAGDDATSKTGIPWYLPGIIALGAGGLYGGYRLTDSLLEKRRQSEIDEELHDARKRYRNLAMRAMRLHKAGSAESVNLDDLATAATEKNAGWRDYVPKPVRNAGGTALGAYSTYATLMALLTGKAVYDMARQRDPRQIAQDAMQQRMQTRFGGLAPLYIQTEQL